MLTLDVFNQDAFSAISLSAAVDRLDYVPHMLDDMSGLFVPDPVRTTDIWIEDRSTGAVVLQTSPRGTAPHQTGGDRRGARSFRTVRIADSSTIQASELQNIREFGSVSELRQLQSEIARRQMKIKGNMSLTREFHKLACVQGKTMDADGSVIYNWETEFGQAIPAEIDFDLDNANPAAGALRKKCNEVTRSVLRGLKGIGVAQRVVGLCGDQFWDNLTTHKEVDQTYANWNAAQNMRGETSKPWSTPMRFGEIDWINYRGTDDGTTVSIPTDKVKFFPVGAGIFRWAQSPGERFEHVNTLGQDFYSAIVLDKDRNSWASVEVYSYPLPICIQPSALHRGRLT